MGLSQLLLRLELAVRKAGTEPTPDARDALARPSQRPSECITCVFQRSTCRAVWRPGCITKAALMQRTAAQLQGTALAQVSLLVCGSPLLKLGRQSGA